MKQPIQYKTTLLLALFFVGFMAHGQVYRKHKSYNNSFKIEKTTELTVKNKYGNIQIITWEKDSVKFEVAIEVRNKKEAKAIAILDDLYIDFVSSKHFLEARTSSISSESFWSDIKDKTGTIFSSDNKMQINYKVYVPNTLIINIENKYGDILLDDQSGAVSINLSHGDLKAHSLTGGVSINLEFAFANINKLNDGKLKLGYKSEFALGSANNLQIESKSSRVQIESVSTLTIKSHRDKYYIDEVENFKGVNSYTFLEIGVLKNNITVEAKYGNIDIKQIESTVLELDFKTENTDINLTKPTNRTMVFKLVYNEKTGLYFPEELKNKETSKKDEEQKLVETTGQLGESTNNPLQVTATLVAGNIRVKTK